MTNQAALFGMHARRCVAAGYVALNPLRARLVERASDWPHSSVGAHLSGGNDGLVSVQPLLERGPRFADLLDTDDDDPAFAAPRWSGLIGHPLVILASKRGLIRGRT